MISDLKSLSKSTRILFLVSFSLLLLIVTRIVSGQWLPRAEDIIWFQYALLLVVLGSFFLEAHFSKPTDVIANSIAVIVTLFAIDVSSSLLWTGLKYLSWFLLIGSFLTIALLDQRQSSTNLRNKIARFFYEIVTFLGQGRILFSIAFILSILSLYRTSQYNFIILIVFWGFVIIVGPSGFANFIDRLAGSFKKLHDNVGEVTGFCEPNIIMFKLNQDKQISKFDLISVDFGEKNIQRLLGIVINDYLLENEKWAKAISIGPYKVGTKNVESASQQEEPLLFRKGSIRKIGEDEIPDEIKKGLIWKNRKDIVGIISENSNIKKIEFELTPHESIEELEEGRLLKCYIGDREVLYQIINAVTKSEPLKGKDEAGYTRGVAQQLGIWDKKTCEFKKYGWVPNLNTLLFLIKEDEEVESTLDSEKNELILGMIPRSKYPVICDTDILISHHTGILGITGSGKSWLAYTLIKEFIENKIKVICVDFTLEYEKDLETLYPQLFFPEEDTNRINKILEGIENQRPSDFGYTQKVNDVKQEINENINKFMEGDSYLGIFELPDISNSFSILEFTQLFLEGVLNYAKNNRDKYKICIVFEEAHTVVPEQTTLGVGGDFGRTKGIVGKISQIALQGRKYSVGFLVIAQRTANVSKTVLNQCNSIIAFNAFDNTGLDFMKNYVGEDMANSIPNLKDLEVIVAGKAFKTKTPMIMKLAEKEGPLI